MTKLNKYQKLILILYGICFIYFSAIHVPFKVYGNDEIIYDTIFSERATLDFSRLILILVVISAVFSLTFILLYNFNLNFPLRFKLKSKSILYFLIGFAFITTTIYLMTKREIKSPAIQNTSLDTIDINTSVVTKIVSEIPESSHCKISNIKFYSNERFAEFVSFTFQKTSAEAMSNLMFREEFSYAKNKKDEFTNKLVSLKPKDSVRLTFKKDHDGLFVYKIRFVSGKTISLNDGFLNLEYKIYGRYD